MTIKIRYFDENLFHEAIKDLLDPEMGLQALSIRIDASTTDSEIIIKDDNKAINYLKSYSNYSVINFNNGNEFEFYNQDVDIEIQFKVEV